MLENGKTFYPDFTIRHPDTGKPFYWEHFGQMDQSNYANHTFNKLRDYNESGYTPTLQLITTFETLDTPLTSVVIEDTIRRYFNR